MDTIKKTPIILSIYALSFMLSLALLWLVSLLASENSADEAYRQSTKYEDEKGWQNVSAEAGGQTDTSVVGREFSPEKELEKTLSPETDADHAFDLEAVEREIIAMDNLIREVEQAKNPLSAVLAPAEEATVEVVKLANFLDQNDYLYPVLSSWKADIELGEIYMDRPGVWRMLASAISESEQIYYGPSSGPMSELFGQSSDGAHSSSVVESNCGSEYCLGRVVDNAFLRLYEGYNTILDQRFTLPASCETLSIQNSEEMNQYLDMLVLCQIPTGH